MSLLVRVFVFALAVGLGAPSIAFGAMRILAGADPAMAHRMLPSQPDALVRIMDLRRARDPDAGLADAAPLGDLLIKAAPLASRPLAFAGAQSIARGELEAAHAQLALAVARDPRAPFGRLWLAYADLATDKPAAALEHLTRLLVLDPSQRQTILPVIGSLAEAPEGRAWLLDFAVRDPATAAIVTGHLNQSSQDVLLLLALNTNAPAQQAGLLARLTRDRGAQAAFIAWLSLLPDEAALSFSWPYNPTFAVMPAPPPFNWSLNRNAVAIDTRGGISVIYPGRQRPLLASQAMLMRPGRYTFRVTQSGDGHPRGGSLVWEIRCEGGTAPILQTEPGGLVGQAATVSAPFEVPGEGCGAQTLSLVGAPGELPFRLRGRVDAVAIEPAGAP